MVEMFNGCSHTLQALIATLFTWGVTALGAAAVFLFKKVNRLVLDAMLGFSAGVMIAASFWSLLDPAIALSQEIGQIPWLVAMVGFVAGMLLLLVGDKVFGALSSKKYGADGADSGRRRMLLVFSITLHNIPEGLAVGVAFGSLAHGIDGTSLAAACLLALGIGIQNFPEGMAVSLPLLREGMSKKKSFFVGQLSGFVEPVAGVIGALLAAQTRALLPFLLSFAAGAMISVVTGELIPESQSGEKKDVAVIFTMIGFVVMMVLDVALG